MGDRRPGWRRPTVLVPVGLLGAVAVTVVLAAFQPWKLIVDETANEALPSVAAPAVPSQAAQASDSTDRSSAGAVADEITDATPEPNSTGEAAPVEPTPERVVTARGDFISHEHGTTGEARLITLADGSRVLRLVDLDTSNGPDLKVWLAAAPVIEGEKGWFVFDDEAYLDLGELKGNKGSQNYPIPDGVDISDLTSVTIWCDRFSVSFGAAELVAA